MKAPWTAVSYEQPSRESSSGLNRTCQGATNASSRSAVGNSPRGWSATGSKYSTPYAAASDHPVSRSCSTYDVEPSGANGSSTFIPRGEALDEFSFNERAAREENSAMDSIRSSHAAAKQQPSLKAANFQDTALFCLTDSQDMLADTMQHAHQVLLASAHSGESSSAGRVGPHLLRHCSWA